MEEQTSWKGHSFTLLVFIGIVVLCSIFFILGMLAGRGQGQKLASVAAAEAAARNEAKAAPKEEKKPDLTFFESVEKGRQPALDPPPKPAPPPPEPAKAVDPPPPANSINYQIAALRKSSEAEKLLDDVKKKGFRGFILAPPPGDANPFYRVQIGPFDNMIDADDAKKKLESAGYQPILKR